MVRYHKLSNRERSLLKQVIGRIEHPEITCSLDELHMIIDVAVSDNAVNIAIALPAQNVPQQVKKKLEQSIFNVLSSTGREINVEYFNMLQQLRNDFFDLAKKNWKEPSGKAIQSC